MAKFNVTGDQHFGITGQMLEIQRQIRLKGGSPIDPDLVAPALQDIIEGKFNHRKKGSAILKLLSIGNPIVIDACDGTETLGIAEEVFTEEIVGFGEFEKLGINKPQGIVTRKTVVQVYEIVKDATYAQMFKFLGVDLDKLCLTQHQIINFCKKYPYWLNRDHSTFFLFRVDKQFFVSTVFVYPEGLLLCVDEFEFDDIFESDESRSHRLVVPQLTA